MRVYHRTSEAAARAILATGRLRTQENTPHAFASTRWDDDSQAAGYGDVVVELDVPGGELILDDEFGDEDDPDFEQHYRVPLTSKIMEAFRVVDGQRVRLA